MTVSASRPNSSCRGDWFIRLLGATALTIVAAFIAAVVWKACS
ncbi:hypothetical protein [Neoroseomonas eburnea]|nr:hypothetical protein [Neoroseomonas eburnea]